LNLKYGKILNLNYKNTFSKFKMLNLGLIMISDIIALWYILAKGFDAAGMCRLF
jgi:hypothetical protein